MEAVRNPSGKSALNYFNVSSHRLARQTAARDVFSHGWVYAEWTDICRMT